MSLKSQSIFVFFITLSVVLEAAAFAQTAPPATTPEEVAERYCKAITNKNSALLLSVIHESSGKDFGESIVKSIKELQTMGEITLSHELFGRTLEDEELASLTWQDALAGLICGPAPSTKTRFRSSTWRMKPNWLGGPGKRVVLGVVHDNAEIEFAHVVYRYEGMSPRPHEDFVNLLTCYKEDERWGIVFPMRMQVSFMLRVHALKSHRNQTMQRSGGGDAADDGEPTLDRS